VPPPSPGLLALPIQLLAGAVIGIHLAVALVAVRLSAADGVLAGLDLLAAATLLRTIELDSWNQIALLAVVLTLRTLLKRLFTWERSRILARQPDLGLRRPP
jgi:hypothetical protein